MSMGLTCYSDLRIIYRYLLSKKTNFVAEIRLQRYFNYFNKIM